MKQQIHELFETWGDDDQQLIAGVENLALTFGADVYQVAMQQLVGKDFEPTTSKRYWHDAIAHRETSCERQVHNCGLRPALLHYLHQVVKEVKDPRIVEADYLNDIVHSSLTDGLTGLHHQTFFKSHLEKVLARHDRNPGQMCAVILLDLDRFKQYNDRCGHLRGDEALRNIGKRLKELVRDVDLAARYGGEEFAVLLPDVDRQEAYLVAERIRKAVEEMEFPREELIDGGTLTISGGISVFPENGESVEDLIEFADLELYQAKKRRNTIYPLEDERRRAARHNVRSLVHFRTEDGAEKTGMAFRISRLGLNLGVDAPLPEGTRLKLHFRPPFWPAEVWVDATVRHVGTGQGQEQELTLLGLCFDETGEIEKLLPESLRTDRGEIPPAFTWLYH